MMNPMYDKIKRMAEADIEEMISKGSIEPDEYPCLGEAIDIVKDIHKIKQMCEEEEMMGKDGEMPYEASGYRMPRYNMRMSNERGGSQNGSYGSYAMNEGSNMVPMDQSQYNPNRSSVTGRYTSRDGASYHDMDGSMRKDLEELLSNTKDDHNRMLIMRLMSKVEQ